MATKWQNGQIAGMATWMMGMDTYILFMVHAADDDTDDDDTLIFYSIDLRS